MEPTFYCVYNCYGLCVQSGTSLEMERVRDNLLKAEQGEAGQDGRKIKFHFICTKEEFVNLIGKLLP